MGMARELGEHTPFVEIAGSELFAKGVSKAEALTQALRRALGVQISEETELIEGEVVEIQIDRPSGAAGASKSGKLTMKTTDMETVYELGTKLIDALAKQNVVAGDVVTIDKATGKVSRVGRSFARSRDYEVTGPAAKFVATPEGELQQRKTVQHTVSLHEMDVINSRAQGFLALFSGETGEISEEVRAAIDTKVSEWQEEGKASLVPGVLFIDEAHVLDLECCAFLNTALEAPHAPLVVLATNRSGVAPVRGSPYSAPHGLPTDLLDRLLIVKTEPLSQEQLQHVVSVRATECELSLEKDSLALLGKIAEETSLRYALRLMTASSTLAARDKVAKITVDHVTQCYTLFVDEKRSTAFLDEHRGIMMFDERDGMQTD
jgi:RuvB-like protein 2